MTCVKQAWRLRPIELAKFGCAAPHMLCFTKRNLLLSAALGEKRGKLQNNTILGHMA
jgi:hypothetical protein